MLFRIFKVKHTKHGFVCLLLFFLQGRSASKAILKCYKASFDDFIIMRCTFVDVLYVHMGNVYSLSPNVHASVLLCDQYGPHGKGRQGPTRAGKGQHSKLITRNAPYK